MTYELRRHNQNLPDEHKLYDWALQRVVEFWGLKNSDMTGYTDPDIITNCEYGRVSYRPYSNSIMFNPDDVPAASMLEEVVHAVHYQLVGKRHGYVDEDISELMASLTETSVMGYGLGYKLNPEYADIPDHIVGKILLENVKQKYNETGHLDPHIGYVGAVIGKKIITSMTTDERREFFFLPDNKKLDFLIDAAEIIKDGLENPNSEPSQYLRKSIQYAFSKISGEGEQKK